MQMLRPCPNGLPDGDPDDNVRDEITHLDIKPCNIFLGHPEHRAGIYSSFGGTRVYDYPVIKLGDYGLAKYTGEADMDNPDGHWGQGTASYLPPEQAHYGALWPRCPNADYKFQGLVTRADDIFDSETGDKPIGRLEWARLASERAKVHFKMLSKANVWSIGKVMYECATLAGGDDYWSHCTKNYFEYKKWNHQIENFDKVPFRDRAALQWSPYSKELTELIKACTDPRVSSRISLEDLCQCARSGRIWYGRQWHEGCDNGTIAGRPQTVLNPKLYYKDNDIVDMPRGPENIVVDGQIYTHMMEVQNGDPDWRQLIPPFDLESEDPSGGEATTNLHRNIKRHRFDPITRHDIRLHEGEIRRRISLVEAGVIAEDEERRSDTPPLSEDQESSSSTSHTSLTDLEPWVNGCPGAPGLDDLGRRPNRQEIAGWFDAAIQKVGECSHAGDNEVTTDPSDTELEIAKETRTRNGFRIQYRAKRIVGPQNDANARARARYKDTRNRKRDAFGEARPRNAARRGQRVNRLRGQLVTFLSQCLPSRADELYAYLLKQAYQQAKGNWNLIDNGTDQPWEIQLLSHLEALLQSDTSENAEVQEIVRQKIQQKFPNWALWSKQKALSPTAPSMRTRASFQVAPCTRLHMLRADGYYKLVSYASRGRVPKPPLFINPLDENIELALGPGFNLQRCHYRTMIHGIPHQWNGNDWYRISRYDTTYIGFDLRAIGLGALDPYLPVIHAEIDDDDDADYEPRDNHHNQANGQPANKDEAEIEDITEGIAIHRINAILNGKTNPVEIHLMDFHLWHLLQCLELPRSLGLKRSRGPMVREVIEYLRETAVERLNKQSTEDEFAQFIYNEARSMSRLVEQTLEENYDADDPSIQSERLKAKIYTKLANIFAKFVTGAMDEPTSGTEDSSDEDDDGFGFGDDGDDDDDDGFGFGDDGPAYHDQENGGSVNDSHDQGGGNDYDPNNRPRSLATILRHVRVHKHLKEFRTWRDLSDLNAQYLGLPSESNADVKFAVKLLQEKAVECLQVAHTEADFLDWAQRQSRATWEHSIKDAERSENDPATDRVVKQSYWEGVAVFAAIARWLLSRTSAQQDENDPN